MVIDTGVSITLDALWWINALDGACPYHPPSIAQEKALLLLPVCYFWHLVNRPSTEHLFLQSPQETEADVAVDEATLQIYKFWEEHFGINQEAKERKHTIL